MKKKLGGCLDDDEAQAFRRLLRGMLAYKPADRPTTEEILKAEWMVYYALPEYERASKGWKASF